MDKNIKDAGDEEIIAWLKECRETASLGGGIIRFARADEKDWQEIKQLSNEELQRSYINSAFMNMESVSLRDAQLTNMMSFELDRRGLIEECDAEIDAEIAKMNKENEEKGYKNE